MKISRILTAIRGIVFLIFGNVVMGLILPQVAGCASDKDRDSDTSARNFGINGDNYNYDLPNAINRDGKFVANIGYRGDFGKPGTGMRLIPSEEQRLQGMIKSSNQEWAGALPGQPGWKQNGPISMEIGKGNYAGCKQEKGGYNCPQKSGHVNFVLDQAVERSSVNSRTSTVTLGKDLFDPQKPGHLHPDAHKLVRHEMGHLYGAADTYRDTPGGPRAWEPMRGQPSSVMMDAWNNNALAPDDQQAARAAWNYRNGSQFPCPAAMTGTALPNQMYCPVGAVRK